MNAGLIVALTVYTIATRKALNSPARWAVATRKFLTTGAAAWAVAIIVVPILFWIALSGVWLPKERLFIGDIKSAPVYVLSSDELWTMYMDDQHSVHIVSTGKIKCRTILGSSRSVWERTLIGIAEGREMPSRLSAC